MDRKMVKMVNILIGGIAIGVGCTNAIYIGVKRYVEKHHQSENDKFILAMKK